MPVVSSQMPLLGETGRYTTPAIPSVHRGGGSFYLSLWGRYADITSLVHNINRK